VVQRQQQPVAAAATALLLLLHLLQWEVRCWSIAVFRQNNGLLGQHQLSTNVVLNCIGCVGPGQSLVQVCCTCSLGGMVRT
jgi:short subunit dehydrogenase-like uncharacterized protein